MANIFLTFDYELFFGRKTGSVEKCLLEPTSRLMQLGEKFKAKFTFFVDVMYLMKLSSYQTDHGLRKDYTLILAQLTELINKGHDIQLHLHPHWLNAVYNGEWHLDYSNYRLQNFSEEDVCEIIRSSVTYLESITNRKVFAFRAGGWCLQPFAKLNQPFVKNGVWLDSTVYHKGYNHSPTHYYDFRNAPDLDTWKFEQDPLLFEKNGFFTELPISSCTVSPLFFWRLLIIKTFFHQKYLSAGDGEAISKSKSQLMRMMLLPTHSVVSVDGYKAAIVQSAFKKSLAHGKENFVIIGHPKAMSKFSIDILEKFLSKTSKHGHLLCSLHSFFEVKNHVSEESLVH